MCLGAFLFFNSFGSINVALPTIQAEFESSLAAIQWISMMGLVMISSLSFCFGRAGNILGQKRLYKLGVLLYAIGAGLGALAASFPQLLFFRAVMSVGLAMALPMSAAILASIYPPDRRGRALGIFAAAIAIGRATGPTVGGTLLHFFGWQSVFVLNFAIGLLVSAAVLHVFKGKEERKRERFDLWGSLALMAGFPSLLIALSLAANAGLGSRPVQFWLALAVIGLVSFFFVERRAERPLIDVALFKRRALFAAVLSSAIGAASYAPINLIAPLFMQRALELSPLAIGFVMAALPVSTALASPVSGRLADCRDPGRVAAAGLALIFAGLVLYATLVAQSTAWSVAVALALVGAGTGVFIPANQKAAFAAVGSEDYGILSAMLSSFSTAASTLGTTLAVALIEMKMTGAAATDPGRFSAAQSFTFVAFLPLAVAALIVSLVGRKPKRAGLTGEDDRHRA
jgi:EmrB/QacA subfamily drug resistance transporter